MIKVETTPERLESKGGLVLAGKMAQKIGLTTIKSGILACAGTIIASLYALLVQGDSAFEDASVLRGNRFFLESLGLKTAYAKETIRLYLEKLIADKAGVLHQLRLCVVALILRAKVHGIWIKGRCFIPVDIDTSPMDNSGSHKEGVSYTYKGFDGYHPLFAYYGREGYLIDCELRPGSQHCQKGTAEFIRGMIERYGKAWKGKRLLFRLDSGNDAYETMEAIVRDGEGKERKGRYLIIKRNKRREDEEKWRKIGRRYGKLSRPRKGKKVFVGSVQIHPAVIRNKKKVKTLKEVRCVFEVIERRIDAAGNRLLLPEVEVNSWWTNLEVEAEKVIELYHAHGTMEQYHSELKSDMGVERLPSGKMGSNEILLAIAMNAYNVLRYMGQESLEAVGEAKRKKFRRRRLGKVIRELIAIAGKLVEHGRELILKLYEGDKRTPVFIRLNAVFDSM
jgi:hypothetical protein